MRRKRNCYDVTKWRGQNITTCSLCDRKATYHIKFSTILTYGQRFLCEEHAREWEKGELYL